MQKKNGVKGRQSSRLYCCVRTIFYRYYFCTLLYSALLPSRLSADSLRIDHTVGGPWDPGSNCGIRGEG